MSSNLITPKELAQVCNEAISEKWDKDVNIAITGYEGSGKSTLAIKIAKLGQHLLGYPFDYFKNIIYTMDVAEIKEKIHEENVKYYIFDEAIKQFYKMEFGTSAVKELVKFFTIIRKLNNVYIFNIPRLQDLTEYFRNHRVQIWIHIFHRPPNDTYLSARMFETGAWKYRMAWGAVMAGDENPFFKDPWHLERIQGLLRKLFRQNFNLLSLHRKMHFFRFYAKENFIGFIPFSHLSPNEYARYKTFNLTFSTQGLLETSEKVMDKMNPFTVERFLKAVKILRKIGWTWNSVARLLNLSKGQLSTVKKYTKKVKVEMTKEDHEIIARKKKDTHPELYKRGTTVSELKSQLDSLSL